MKKVTMQDIASGLGVSKMTVSKAFKNSSDIPEETKAKVIARARQLGYIYNRQKRYFVTVIVSELFFDKNEEFYNGLYKRFNEASGLRNIVLSLVVLKKFNEDDFIIDYNINNNDAIIILGQVPKSFLVSISKMNIPVICVDFYYRNLGLDTISSNNFNASYNITSYLIDLGHKEIGFIGKLNSTTSINDRFLGYYKALLENNLQVHSHFHINDRNSAGEKIKLVLPQELPTAFVCNNDHVAYELINQLKDRNILIPDQVSVVGFDDVIYSTISEPQITTIRVPRKYMAETALDLVMRRIKTKGAEVRNINIECRLIERDSVRKIA